METEPFVVIRDREHLQEMFDAIEAAREAYERLIRATSEASARSFFRAMIEEK